ncbi:glycosyltransferase family 4 protein [Amaricoccus macauensis]|uniref:glycosyltransferase family 4 protein n=1 Tax=Amaricoccus macauensis TaxID=57001 RepID=UPI003C7D590C
MPLPDASGLPRSVLFVVPRFHTNLAIAVRALRDAGCAVHVFATAQSPIEDHSLVVPEVFSERARRDDVVAALRAAAPDLVFIRSSKPVSRYVGEYCRLRRIRAYSYGLSPLTVRPRLRRQISRFLDGQPLRRVTPVRGLERDAPPDPKATYLPWPVAAPVEPPEWRSTEGPLRVLCVGKLAQPRKNQHLLVGALDALDRPEDLELTLAGALTDHEAADCPDHYRALVERSRREGRVMPVRIVANVPYAKMPELYSGHDICVLPADREPLGMAPLEAMAFGLVPVFSAQCGSAGSVTDGRDGFVIDMHDPEALRSLLARLCEDRALVAKVGRSAWETARTELGLEAFVARVAALAP